MGVQLWFLKVFEIMVVVMFSFSFSFSSDGSMSFVELWMEG
jgi:hypothetical protein